jgi:hypothetical protein
MDNRQLDILNELRRMNERLFNHSVHLSSALSITSDTARDYTDRQLIRKPRNAAAIYHIRTP